MHDLLEEPSQALLSRAARAPGPYADTAVLDALTDGVYAVDEAWRILFMNRAAAACFHLERDACVGERLWTVLPKLCGTEFERRYRDVMASREPTEFVTGAAVNTGRSIEVRAFPVGSGIAVVFRDITDRRQVEDALRRSEAELRQITDALPVLISYVDRQERFQFNNLAYERWAQTPREDIKGRQVRDVVGRENYARVKPYIDKALAGERCSFEWRGVRLDTGEAADFRSDYIPRIDEDGRPDGFYVLFTDVTDIKLTEKRLQQLNLNLEAAVAERTAALSQALAQLRAESAERQKAEEALRHSQKMEAVGQLTGGVAHDFNNLLTVIQSSVDLLRRTEDQDRRERYLEAISTAAGRAATLTSQLLAFARRQPLQREVFELGSRIRNLVGLLQTTLGGRYALSVHVAETDLMVEADPSQFDTAILNLALNARDAMPDGGRLTIAAASAGAEVQVSLQDTGCGIPADVMGRIFEPFFTTKPVGKGTGLGLSQVYGFASQSGGRVDVANEPGSGARFTIHLPRTSSPPPAKRQAEPREQRPSGRVLVVEDNQLVADFACQLLQELGWQTEWASDAAAGLARLQADAQTFDLVLSDVVMPGEMSGLDLAAKARQLFPRLPILLASGYSHVLVEKGTLGFPLLQKPYSLEKLESALLSLV
jgi:PAS domain S-box-containing protein